MAKFLNIIGTAIIIIVIVLCLSLIVPRAFGITCYTVLTGSMEPAIPVGSLVYVKGTEPSQMKKGDVAVFYDGRNDVPITHRIVENRKDEAQLITKGDANKSNDIAPIPYYNIIGKVVMHVPAAGRLSIIFGSIRGKIAILLVILGGFLLCEIARRLRQENE